VAPRCVTFALRSFATGVVVIFFPARDSATAAAQADVGWCDLAGQVTLEHYRIVVGINHGLGQGTAHRQRYAIAYSLLFLGYQEGRQVEIIGESLKPAKFLERSIVVGQGCPFKLPVGHRPTSHIQQAAGA
jgi:hypothetical protein